MSEKTWAEQEFVWVAAYFVQAIPIGLFLSLQRKEIVANAAPADASVRAEAGTA